MKRMQMQRLETITWETESTHWVSLTVNEYLYFNQKCCYILKVYFLLQDRFAAIAQ